MATLRTPGPRPHPVTHRTEFPSLGEYWDALQLDLGIVLADPALAGAWVRSRAPGRPVVYGGTFAYTFRLAAETHEYALRCFRREFPALHVRYPAIQAHLRQAGSPRFAALQFQPSGITTETGDYPVVRLDWVDGVGLASFVAGHLGDSRALQQLRRSLRRLAQDLRSIGVAHGDIQPSNIIVEADGNLRLVDYDGMFVPALASLEGIELGQRHFQHPGRRPHHFDASLDAFPFAVIDVALHALVLHPQLWDHTASGQDAFLFRATDFGDPARSALFQRLGQEAALAQRVQDLASTCAAPFAQVPGFEDFLAGRNVPHASVGLRGSDTRAAYVPVAPVVDASDFPQCCKHVGERVELVGRVLHVARTAAEDGGACVSLEFDLRPRDLACATIWPEALSDAGAFAAHDWLGQWVSATGLIEPVAREGTDAQHRKYVAISVTELCQLRRLPEAEARERLHAGDASGERKAGQAGGVWTDPVAEPGAMPSSAAVIGPAAREPDVAAPSIRPIPPRRPGGRRGWLAAAAVVVAALGAVLVARLATDRHRVDVVMEPRVTAGAPVVAPDNQVVAAPTPGSPAVLESQRDLRPTDTEIETAAGTLRIAEGEEGACRRVLRLEDLSVEGTCADQLVLAHHAVFSDREVVVGFRKCAEESVACRWRQPFWLELRTGAEPALRERPGLWVGSATVAIEAADDTVHVDLGTWNGERRTATLTAMGNLVVERERVQPAPLAAADCASVARSLEDCAASRDCGSFSGAARRIPEPRWANLQRLYHESTGLDAEAYRKLCVRSCQLGLSPSTALVRQYACQGAQPGQWLTDDPAGGLER